MSDNFFVGADLVPLIPTQFSKEDARALQLANEMGMGEQAANREGEVLPTESELKAAYELAMSSYNRAKQIWTETKQTTNQDDALSRGNMEMAMKTIEKLTQQRDKLKLIRQERAMQERALQEQQQQSMNPYGYPPQQPQPPQQAQPHGTIPFPTYPPQNPAPYYPQPQYPAYPPQVYPESSDVVLRNIQQELLTLKAMLSEVIKNTTPPKQPKLKKKVETPVTE